MSKYQTEAFPVDDTLDPQNALPGFVKKHDIIQWERALKHLLLVWMQNASSPFSSVQSDLQSPIFESHLAAPHLSSNLSTHDTYNSDNKPEAKQTVVQMLALQVLSDLHRHGALPAIIFNYDRKYCEKIISSVENQLRIAEDAWKATAPGWKKKLIEYENWKRTRSPIYSKKKERTLPHEAGVDKRDIIKENANKETSAWEHFDPGATLEMFSFADKTKLLDSEFEDIVKSLENAHLRPNIIDALRRGMGVHHAGMNREYRQV